MTSDVEVGAFLSGGIDSSLLVSIMARELGLTPKTFTIGFSDSTYDERTFARIAAQAFGTDHYEECLDRWDSDRLRQLITNHVGQPFADASLLPTALVSQVASEHVKVALSGDGGDELFSGYQRYQARAILRWYTRLPGTIRKQIGKIIRAIPEPMAHHSRSLIKKAHLFLDVATRQNDETPYIAPLMHSREDLLRLAPDLVHLGHEPPGLARETRLDDIATMMINDALIYLPQDILLKVDRASMAHSIETRAPFLDRELIELAFSFPRDWHRRGHMGKRMLRDTFTSRLPKQLWKRRKQGFGVPLHRWFRGRLGAELENTLHSINTPIQASRVQELLAEHRKGYRDHGYRLWQIFVYLSHHAQQPSH
jgi:asparagine synthase (glutamine-hydrolysing)